MFWQFFFLKSTLYSDFIYSKYNRALTFFFLRIRVGRAAVFLLHPGYVRTDMTLGNGLIDTEESVSLAFGV